MVENRNEVASSSRIGKVLFALVVAAVIFGLGFQVGRIGKPALVDQAINEIVANQPDVTDRVVLERAAIEAALKASGDEWANYFPRSALEILNERNSNQFTGIGVSLRKSRGGVIEISSVDSKSPAEKGGVKVGDELLQVNGTNVQGASLTSVIAMIRGEVGKKIDLLIARDSEKILLSLNAKKIAASSVDSRQVSREVGLVSIANFSAGTALSVEKAIKDLDVKDGLIIDLRNNPGGLVSEAVNVAQLFIGNGTVVSYRVNGEERVFSARNSKPMTIPVIVMINRATASAAEILAAALQDRNRGVVIGEKSYGKGSVQEFVTLDDGSKLELTVALYVTPSGRTIEGEGVTPDLSVRTEELGSKALQILGGLAALTTNKS
ncbi:MAG: hypothetical protein RLZZ317_824 [Actinomycetota bacterium]